MCTNNNYIIQFLQQQNIMLYFVLIIVNMVSLKINVYYAVLLRVSHIAVF